MLYKLVINETICIGYTVFVGSQEDPFLLEDIKTKFYDQNKQIDVLIDDGGHYKIKFVITQTLFCSSTIILRRIYFF